MKKKLLIMGNNKRLITDFFMQLDFYFDCASTSLIAPDLRIHYQFLHPDAIVYCMHAESRDNINSVIRFADGAPKDDKVPFIVVADGSDYEFLCKMPGGRADLRIGASASVSELQSEISSVIARHKNNKIEGKLQTAPKLDDALDTLSQLDEELKKLESGDLNVNLPTSLLSALGRPRILVVDDSTIIHKAIKGYIEKDYDISTAINGAAALRFLKTKEVNLILLDYEMPEMNGAEVLKALRENPLTASIPVVFLTGVNDTAKIQKVLRLKPDGYLLKPIDKNVLLSKIKEILG